MPDGAIPERVRRLRAGMQTRGFDVLICLKPQNTFYVSDFNPVIYSHPVVAVLPLEGEPALLVHALRDDHARASSWIRDVRLYGAWSTKQTMGPDWLTALCAILGELGVAAGRLGVEFDFLPVGIMGQMERCLPDAQLEDASDVIMHARLVKDPVELDRMRRAAFLADRGMEAAIAAAAARCSEREISLAAMTAMNQLWAERFPETEVADFGSFEGGVINGLWCYCLIGDRIMMNCDVPTTRLPEEGEMGLIVIWAVCDGMHAENERTVAFGRLDPERQRMYDVILRVRAETAQAIRPGVMCAEVYNAARMAYESQGYGRYLPGRVGHGIGLGPHEHPSVGPADATRLEPGMVLTLEPNLRIPGLGGLQHSDTIVITDSGFEFLTDVRRDFIQV